jgi:hypothetical protein
MIFWLVLKLEISYRVKISWRILVCFKGFFWRLYFCRWNIRIFIILLLFEDTLWCKLQGHSGTHPLFCMYCMHLSEHIDVCYEDGVKVGFNRKTSCIDSYQLFTPYKDIYHMLVNEVKSEMRCLTKRHLTNAYSSLLSHVSKLCK